ncbi:MAG: MutS-related protein [Rhodanobacter sp.]
MSIRFFLDSARKKLLHTLLPRRKSLAGLRAQWGKQGAKDGWFASHYFNLVRHEFDEVCVDDKTWRDLEFPAIFSRLDSTVTPLGSQSLFRRLREYARDPGELTGQYAVYTKLRSDVLLREEIQLKLAGLQHESNANIAGLIFDDAQEKLGHQGLLGLWGLVSIAALTVMVALSWSVWIWLLIITINVIIIYHTYQRVHRNTEAMKSCIQVLNVADRLASMHKRHPSIPQLNRLAEETASRAEMRKALGWLSIMTRSPISYFSVWFNVAFLAELIAFARTADKFFHIRSKLVPTFEAIGSLDAAIAIASYLEQCPDHCQPVVVDRPLLDISEARHPLLANPVKNSICLEQRSALITGSNMAGKTTFIKMVGINIIFGRTLGFCLASKAIIPQSSVMASIRGEHSVESGKSHYFSEIETIHSFIESEKQGDCRVFVIDELFNGTNTVERVAAARAVLESICRNSLVLVTTHDVELQTFLRNHYDLHHFQEEPDVDGFFDYKLRSGAATERNAIRLLGRMGFPDEVIENAMAYAAQGLNSIA